MTTPITKYAPSEGGYVAYQVFGSGPLNLVFVTSWVTNVDVMWEEPHMAAYLHRLASFARVLCFDKPRRRRLRSRASGIAAPARGVDGRCAHGDGRRRHGSRPH